MTLRRKGAKRVLRALTWVWRWPREMDWDRLCNVGPALRPWARAYHKSFAPRGIAKASDGEWAPCNAMRRPKHRECFGGVELYGMNLSRAEFDQLDLIYFPFPYEGVTPKGHGTGIDWRLLPPRRKRHLWVLLNAWESASTWPVAFSTPFLQLFNLTVGYHPGLMHLRSFPRSWMPSDKRVAAFRGWTAEQLWDSKNRSVLASALMSGAGCRSDNHREGYLMGLLAAGFSVDSFGMCQHNAELPFVSHPKHFRFTAKEMVLPRYKFSLAFENSNCQYWVTEKVLQPLIAGSVPVYLGAPNARDLVPNATGVIFASDFASPRALARHLVAVGASRERYLRYHAWRQYPLSDGFAELQRAARSDGGNWGLCEAAQRVAWSGSGTASSAAAATPSNAQRPNNSFPSDSAMHSSPL